jgi:hypothetical protein
MLGMEIDLSDSSKTTKTKILDFLKVNPEALTKQFIKVTVHESGKAGGRYTSRTRINPPYFGRADETAEIAAGEIADCVKRHSTYRIDRAQLLFFEPPVRTSPSDATD